MSCNIFNISSEEFKNKGTCVVEFVEGQEDIRKKSGTMRLGAYDCSLTKGSIARQVYGRKMISERHRHRYEVSDTYAEQCEGKGFIVSGRNPQTNRPLQSASCNIFPNTQGLPLPVVQCACLLEKARWGQARWGRTILKKSTKKYQSKLA